MEKRVWWRQFVAATLPGEAIRLLQNELEIAVVPGFLIILVTAKGGIAESQTVATIICAMAPEEATIKASLLQNGVPDS